MYDIPAGSTRLTTDEVCEIARFSKATLWRRIASGRMPQPVDWARQALFEEEQVYSALTAPVQSRRTLRTRGCAHV